MELPTDEQVRKECDELGEAGVEARINAGHFARNLAPAFEWLIKRRLEAERKRNQKEIRYTRWAVYASWVLALASFIGIYLQTEDARQQRELVKEQLEQQRKDSQAQRNDAKALLTVQISVEFDKQFDSREMRQARRTLARQLLNGQEVTETRAIDFFDKLAMYKNQGRIDEDTVYKSYSYWIERYWPALKTKYIDGFRQQEDDSDYYGDFEELYKEMLTADAKDRGKAADKIAPNKAEIHRFLIEESTLP